MFPWISFLSYVFIMTYSPGPNNIMSMNNAKNAGLKKGITFNLGAFAGFFGIMILCLIFSSFLFAMVPKIQFPMKLLGASYMVYLIIKTLLPQKEHETKVNNIGFFTAIVLQLINPKLILYGITIMSTYLLPHFKQLPLLLLFCFLLAVVGLSSTISWALFGSLFSKLFSKHGKALNIIMALLLLYCVISLFI